MLLPANDRICYECRKMWHKEVPPNHVCTKPKDSTKLYCAHCEKQYSTKHSLERAKFHLAHHVRTDHPQKFPFTRKIFERMKKDHLKEIKLNQAVAKVHKDVERIIQQNDKFMSALKSALRNFSNECMWDMSKIKQAVRGFITTTHSRVTNQIRGDDDDDDDDEDNDEDEDNDKDDDDSTPKKKKKSQSQP